VIQGSDVTYQQARALGHLLRQRVLDGQLMRAHRVWPRLAWNHNPAFYTNGEVLTTGVRVHSYVALDYLIGAIEHPPGRRRTQQPAEVRITAAPT
jgi:hypothetical protein